MAQCSHALQRSAGILPSAAVVAYLRQALSGSHVRHVHAALLELRRYAAAVPLFPLAVRDYATLIRRNTQAAAALLCYAARAHKLIVGKCRNQRSRFIVHLRRANLSECQEYPCLKEQHKGLGRWQIDLLHAAVKDIEELHVASFLLDEDFVVEILHELQALILVQQVTHVAQELTCVHVEDPQREMT